MRVTCTNCGGDHARWNCKRPATKSTAPLTEVAPCAPGDNERLHRLGRRGAVSPDKKAGIAGTQALPVDTNSEPLLIAAAIPQRMGPSPRKDEGTEAPKPKRPRGRPKSITDMKTYKAAKQREYRAKWKGRE